MTAGSEINKESLTTSSHGPWKVLTGQLRQLNLRVDSLIKMSQEILNTQTRIFDLLNQSSMPDSPNGTAVVPDAIALWSLPISLRKTMLALYKLGEATADDLSVETKRLRAVESSCANQLARMGYLKKRRDRRNVVFFIENETPEG